MLRALASAGFEQPTDIQRELIPVALRGDDCLGQARTGTGKTAAFALPMLQRVQAGQGLQALVLVPTRELATQVDEHVRTLGREHALKTALILGGREIRKQVAALKGGAEIVVGTPGRVLDLMHRKELKFDTIRLAVLDEVDRMLDIGFRDDIRKILKAIPGEHQTIFVSATIDQEIHKLARTFMRASPIEVNVSQDELTVESVRQGFITIDPRDKYPSLISFLRHEKPKLAIVFCNTKHQARRVAQNLAKDGVSCKELHGDLMQTKRERVMESFRKAHIQVLVATDLASRGLDVLEVSHIVNYDIPQETAVYVHRVGRTARMGKSGYAVTFVTPEQGKMLTDVEKLINKELLNVDESWVVRRHALPEAQSLETAVVEPVEPGGIVTPQRLKEVTQPCAVLESYGIKPMRRTLGSRFKSARKFRR